MHTTRLDSVVDVGGKDGEGCWGGCCVSGVEATPEGAPERLLSSAPIGELGGGLLPSVWPMGVLPFPDPFNDRPF
jgi:hypothetical protein